MPDEIPYREIWLSPHCEKCVFAETTWCQHNVYEPCGQCGMKPVRYALDKRRSRSLPQHRLFWRILQHVAKATQWEYPERLLIALKIRLGRYDLLQLPNGKLAPVPHSISFRKMPQEAFQEFFDQCLWLICTEVLPGYDPEALMREVEAA